MNRQKEPDKKTFIKENNIFETKESVFQFIRDTFTPPSPASRQLRNATKYSDSKIEDMIHSKLSSDLYAKNSSELLDAILNTAEYIMTNFRRGVYVSFRDGNLKIYAGLTNLKFINPFVRYLSADKSINSLEQHLKLNNPTSWVTMNCIVGNVFRNLSAVTNDGYEVGYHHTEYKVFLEKLCSITKIPDCDFFLNYHDQILLHEKLIIPFWHITNGQNKVMTRYVGKKFVPIVSTSTKAGFLDIPFIFPDDITRLWKSFGVPKCSNPYIDESKYELNWESKKPTAVFRGSATGCGWTVETNDRLHIAYIAQEYGKIEKYKDFFDIKLTGLDQTRFKKNKGEPVRFFLDQRVSQDPTATLSMVDQSKYKYLIYAEGNVVAYRLSAMFGMGSVVIYIEGDYQPWFYPLLKHGVNCIILRSPKELPRTIEWCRANDKICKKIAKAGMELYHEYFSKEGIFQYSKLVIRNIAFLQSHS